MVCVLVGTNVATVFGQSFAAPVDYAVGSNPAAAAYGDFNGDGKADLAVANNGTNNVSVLLGNADGTFGAKTDYDVGQPAYGVVATHLNGDGKLDLAVETSFSLTQRVSVLLGNGDGTFQPRVDYSFSGLSQPNAIQVSDFNNDAKTDVVVVNGSGATVFLGNGDGTLGTPANYGGSNFATSVAVGDFNADGKIDLAVSSYGAGPNGVVSVMLGKGDGTFFPPVNYSSAVSPFSIVKADFNGDGKLDLATANIQVDNVSVLLGNGDGTFQAFVNYATPRLFPYELSVGDLNNDGKSDIVVVGGGSGLSILKGKGDGTFQESVNFEAGARFVINLDLNGDSKLDLIAGWIDSISVLLNQTGPYTISGVTRDNNGAALSAVMVFLTGGATMVSVTDATGAYAFNDLTAGQTYTEIPVKTHYTFEPDSRVFSNLSSNVTADFVGRLNTYSISGKVRDSFGNGMAGVAVTLSGATSQATTTSGDGSYAFANLAAGQNYTVTPSFAKFQFIPPFATVINLSSSRVINFIGSVATYTISGGVTNVDTGSSSVSNFTMVLSGTRTGTAVTDSFGYSFSGLPVDGNYTVTAYAAAPNAVFTNFVLLPPSSRSFAALSSNMTGNFSAKRLGFSTGPDPLGIARGDLNGDGKQDVVVAATTGTNINVLLGNGDGTFQPHVAYSAASNPINVAIADFNGDGKLDVVSTNFFGSNVSVFIGNGDGTLQTRVDYPAGSQPNHLSVADFNSDGKLDLATLGSPNTLSILLGNGNGTFQAPSTSAISTAAFSILPADLNGDGKLDLVTLGFPGSMLVLLGHGDGTFENPVTYAAANEVVKATFGDLNNDGKLDVAVAARLPNKLLVFFGRGDGTFQNAITTSFLLEPADLIANDFDGDGKQDIAVAGSSGSVGLLAGNGDGTFGSASFYPASFPRRLVAGHFNNDGRLDIALTSGNGEVNTLLNALLTRTPTIQLSNTNYTVSEGDGHAQITLTRGGDTTVTATVDYRTVDTDTFTFGCSETTSNLGAAYGRCDFATLVGTVTFAPGETTKVIDVPILDDSYAEGNESFSVTFRNANGAVLVTPATATVTINDNETANGSNPVLQGNSQGITFFVRQHYLDFLGREPEPTEPWSEILSRCADQFNFDPANPSAACDRITVSGGFFGSPEFKDKGVYVIDFYRASFNRLPLYSEFVSDLASLVGTTAPEVFAKRASFANSFTQRGEFMSIYGSLTNSSYVSALMAGSRMQNYNLTSITTADPDDPNGTNKVTLTAADLTSRLDAGTLTRGQVLRAIVQSDQIVGIESLNAFVGSQYYGYLRRTPDTPGFNSWINYLTAHPGDFRTMVHGFVNSREYRLRFGPQ